MNRYDIAQNKPHKIIGFWRFCRDYKFQFYLGQPNHHLMKEVKANFIATGTTVEKFPLVVETDYNIPVLEKNIIFNWSYILSLLIYIFNLEKQFWMQREPEWRSLEKFMKPMKRTFLLLIDSKDILTFIHVRILRKDSKQKIQIRLIFKDLQF